MGKQTNLKNEEKKNFELRSRGSNCMAASNQHNKRLEVETDKVFPWSNGRDDAVLEMTVLKEVLVRLLDLWCVLFRLPLGVPQGGVIWRPVWEIDAHVGLVVLGMEVAGSVVDVIYRTTLPHRDAVAGGITSSLTLQLWKRIQLIRILDLDKRTRASLDILNGHALRSGRLTKG
jgi:hypothetical protein